MFQDFKLLIVEHTGLAKDALHIYVALIVFVAVCAVFRWPASSWKPWLSVLAVTLLGEALDIQNVLEKRGAITPSYHWLDFWNTMLLPTVLVILTRYTSIFAKKPDEIGPSELSDQPTQPV